jgi:hypothetical protein
LQPEFTTFFEYIFVDYFKYIKTDRRGTKKDEAIFTVMVSFLGIGKKRIVLYKKKNRHIYHVTVGISH